MEFTFDNGIKAKLYRVSPLTWNEFEKGIKRPIPPMQHTELGDEPNYAHPDYLAELSGFDEKVAKARFDAFLILGVDVEIDKELVARMRDRAERLHIPIDADDHLAYVKTVCITTDNDLANLTASIMGVSIPTEDKISERAEAFKSPVAAE